MKLLLCLLVTMPVLLAGQGPVGEWKSHVSFNQVNRVAETDEAIVAATSNGILLVNKKGAQPFTKTKAHGLSEVGITAIASAKNTNQLLIGYESGNLDLLVNDRITNYPEIANKSTISDKTILKIICEDNFAYICCAFGIVKFDLQRLEVAETWYLGSGLNLKRVNDLTTYNNNWFAATDKGIYKAEKRNSNLQDYRNWILQPLPAQKDANFSSLAQKEGQLFAHDLTNDRLWAWDGINWQAQNPEIKNIKRINTALNGINVITNGTVWSLRKTGNYLIDSYLQNNEIQKISPEDVLSDSNGTLWIGDSTFGLTSKTNNTFQHYLPNGPAGNHLTALKAGSEAIFAATAEQIAGSENVSLSIYQDGIWQNFASSDDEGLKSIGPVTAFAFNKNHPDEYWASSAGSGMLYFQNNRVSANFTESNSALGAIGGSCVVTGIATDQKNNLWYTNPTGKARLGTRTASGSFISLAYPGMGYSNSPIGEILVTSTLTNWVILPEEGLFAFKTKGSLEDISDDQFKKIAVKSKFSNGNTTLISQFSAISSAIEDLNGELWVGTGTGVVVYNNPDKIFESGEFYGAQPSSEDEDGLFKPILEKEKVTAIAVDGGNRKWLGSANSGVFLFTAEGEHLLHHFDSKNSPLPSDNILSIAINTVNGEVFFATTKGLVSYMGNATAGEAALEKAYVWPNPVRETFEGEVTIDGLTEGTDIKITDLSGNLIYKSSSIGGRARWNAKNAKGVRVSTGIYLIFCSSPQIKATKIIKLLVIH